MGVSGTCFNVIPQYTEHQRIPNAAVTSYNITGGKFILRSIKWPTNYPQCNTLEDESMCKDAPPVVDPNFYNDIKDYLHCKDEDGRIVVISLLNTTFLQSPSNNNLDIINLPYNGTFCNLHMNT